MALSSSRLAAEFSLRWICLRCSIEEAWRWLSSARSDAVTRIRTEFITMITSCITQWILSCIYFRDAIAVNPKHRWSWNQWHWFSCLGLKCQIKALPSLAFPSSSSSKRNVCSSCSDCCLRMSRVLLWASFRAWTSSLCSCFKRSSKAWAEKHSRKKWGHLYSVKQEEELQNRKWK